MEKTKYQKKFSKTKIINLRNFNNFLLALIIALGIFYVAGANDLAVKGFDLSDLKKQSNKITNENRKLELKIISLRSYNVVSEKIDNLKMVAVGEIDYLNANNETVVKK